MAAVKQTFGRLYTIVVSLACLAAASYANAEDALKVSKFGEYSGYEEQLYSQYTRTSQYVTVEDGTPLAVDVFRPALKGQVEGKPLPVIFYYGRYWRAKQLTDGTIMTNLGPWQPGQKIGTLQHRDASGRLIFWDTGRESIVDLMRHGYVFVRAESRGTGASGGIRDGEHSLTEARDGAALIKWIEQQPWSDGKVGMIGGSYPGMTQLKIAAEAPSALKAIFPAVPSFDFFQLASGGSGLLHKGILSFGQGQAAKDGLTAGSFSSRVVAVDDDGDRSKLAAILAQRKAGSPQNATFAALQDSAPEFAYTVGLTSKMLGHSSILQTMGLFMSPPHLQQALAGKLELQEKIARGLHLYRDTPAFSQAREAGMVSPHIVMDAINKAAIPTYVWTGWFDQDTVGAFNFYANLQGPKKIASGTWSHGPNEDNGRADNPRDAYEAQSRELLNVEALRWFDYWLKDIDNGIMNEPSVHYSYAVSPTELVWHSSEKWPLTDTKSKAFYLSGKSDAFRPEDDAQLVPAVSDESVLSFTVDYTKSMGPQSRAHDSMSGAPAMLYSALQAHAEGEGALTITSDILDEDLMVVGHPQLTLYAKSTSIDGDVFAYLEEVEKDGTVKYLTEGLIRASHRDIGDLPYDSFGVPYSASDRASVAKAADFNSGFVALKIAMQPTANLFEKGSSIRLVITGGDMHNYVSPVFSPSPQIMVQVGGKQASVLELPTVAMK